MIDDTPIEWIGSCDYELGLQVQNDTAAEVRKTLKAKILACEHPTVITLGKRGQPLTDILTSMETLREKNIKIVATDRGGQATLHNPGQLVIYPIIPLREWKLGVKNYVECLERATAYFLAEYGIEVTRGYEPGLFSNGQKIAAFGIRVDRGVTQHGLAININNNLETFSLIRQCGQVVLPTNIQKEMESFGASKDQWDFAEEAEKWKNLFLVEVKSLFEPIISPALAVSETFEIFEAQPLPSLEGERVGCINPIGTEDTETDIPDNADLEAGIETQVVIRAKEDVIIEAVVPEVVVPDFVI